MSTTRAACEGGVTVRWCPRCGACTCPPQNAKPDGWEENPTCPIHGSQSQHGERQPEDAGATAALSRKPLRLDVSKEWCVRMAAAEEGHDISAGGLAALPEDTGATLAPSAVTDEQMAELLRWIEMEVGDADSDDDSYPLLLCALRELQQRRAQEPGATPQKETR